MRTKQEIRLRKLYNELRRLIRTEKILAGKIFSDKEQYRRFLDGKISPGSDNLGDEVRELTLDGRVNKTMEFLKELRRFIEMKMYLRRDLLVSQEEVEGFMNKIRSLEKQVAYSEKEIPELKKVLEAKQKTTQSKLEKLQKTLALAERDINIVQELRERHIQEIQQEITRIESEREEAEGSLAEKIQSLKESLPRMREELREFQEKLNNFVEIEVSEPKIWVR